MSTPKVSTKLPAKSRLGSWPVPLLWLALLALSVSIFAGWSALTARSTPAGTHDRCNRARRERGKNPGASHPFLGAQALIAAMVAKSITGSILVTFSHQYWLFFGVYLSSR